MIYPFHLLLGFLLAFLGSIVPGMLNMITLRVSIEKGLSSALRFSSGAASMVFIYAFIALTFSRFIGENPVIIDVFKKMAIIVFFALALYFYKKAKKKIRTNEKSLRGNTYFSGLLMASMNMGILPSYFVYGTIFGSNGWLILKQPFITFFLLGVIFGAFSVFAVYARFAQVITKRVQFIARNINFILSGLFVILTVIQLIQVFYGEGPA